MEDDSRKLASLQRPCSPVTRRQAFFRNLPRMQEKQEKRIRLYSSASCPPSITTDSPVMNDASSDARKA